MVFSLNRIIQSLQCNLLNPDPLKFGRFYWSRNFSLYIQCKLDFWIPTLLSFGQYFYKFWCIFTSKIRTVQKVSSWISSAIINPGAKCHCPLFQLFTNQLRWSQGRWAPFGISVSPKTRKTTSSKQRRMSLTNCCPNRKGWFPHQRSKNVLTISIFFL